MKVISAKKYSSNSRRTTHEKAELLASSIGNGSQTLRMNVSFDEREYSLELSISEVEALKGDLELFLSLVKKQ